MKHSIDHRIILPDGTEKWVHEEAIPTFDDHGNPVHLIGTVQDITDRKKYELELIKAKESAEQANRVKTDFLTHMSHELRTPLNGILGFAQLLEKEDLTSFQKEYVEVILKSGKNLLQLINDILDLSQILFRNIYIHLKPVSLNKVIQDNIQLIRPIKDYSYQQIENKIDTPDLYVIADEQRLNQVIYHLLNNAIEFNRPGGIITIDTHYTRGKKNRIRINITDQGYGISEDNHQRIYEPFNRLGKEKSGKPGTGIGLTLVKKYVELMGGSLGLESKVNKGSTFWVELDTASNPYEDINCTPLIYNASEYNQNYIGLPDKTYKILYIEDDIESIHLIDNYFRKKSNVNFLSEQTGYQGIEQALRQIPDLILLDISLADTNGYEVLAKLRIQPLTKNIPIIAVTVKAFEEDRKAALYAGFYEFIEKPINFNQLDIIIEDILTHPYKIIY